MLLSWKRFALMAILLGMAIFVYMQSAQRAESPESVRFSGFTMGTTYSVQLAHLPQGLLLADVQAEVERVLVEVNQQMSTYVADSELSLLNQAATETSLPLSAPLFKVLSAAQQLSQLSDGAFDMTVGPLVNLWGFGPDGERTPPSAEAIAQAREGVGSQWVALDQQAQTLRKQRPSISIDLSAIAKGYGVDAVADYLLSIGIAQALVDIGGELKALGLKPSGVPWRVAIEQPTPGRREVQTTIALTDMGIATSGDYRNYYEVDGIRYSHTIDPRTAQPISHSVASVSVLHPSVMWADGWATTLMVLGYEAGLALAEANALAVLFIVKTEQGFELKMSSAFAQGYAE